MRRDRYHHGALREALLTAADEILTERGTDGFTLREAARRAGVSPAAPAHHFGSVTGLLTEVATRGFLELRRYLREGADTDDTSASSRIVGMAVGYLRFALDHPGRFQLMFRRAMLHSQDPSLKAAVRAAYGELEQAIHAYLGGRPDEPLRPDDQAAVLGTWSLVHGFSHLALDGKFDAMAGQKGVRDSVERMLPAIALRMLPRA
jgi:AcrR family transcriptional regulator